MIVRDHPALSLSRQCRLLSLGRSSLYYEPKGESAETLVMRRMMRRIDELFLKYPFYGARRMALHLRREGVRIGRRRAARLMRLMGLQAIYRAPRTSAPHPEHRIYPYLLRGLAIERPNHVWCADITFYEATVVKRESGYVSGTTPVLPRSSGPELRIARLGTFLVIRRAPCCADPPFIRPVSGSMPDPCPNPACCGRNVPGDGTHLHPGVFQPR